MVIFLIPLYFVDDFDQAEKKGNNVMEKLSTQGHFEGQQSTDKLPMFNVENERTNNPACTRLEKVSKQMQTNEKANDDVDAGPKSMFTEMSENKKRVKDTFDNISPTCQTEINNVKKRNAEETFSIGEDVEKKLQNSGIKRNCLKYSL